MDLANEYVLSFYKELTQIDKLKKVSLLQHIETGDIFVKKYIEKYCLDVYLQLKENPIESTPRIIEVLDDADGIIVIEEYIKGKTLQRILDEEGVFSEARVQKYMETMTIIVEELHELTPPVIHRDIKPDNIILSDDGQIKLIDFGASKNINKDNTRDTHLLGTQNFAAPEQYGFGSSDVRTDVYGIGATFNYLLTKKSPNEGIAEGRLHDILKKCLMLSPDERYQCMYDLYADIIGIRANGYEKELNTNNSYYPVGFRSNNKFAMIGATVYYSICVFAFLVLSIGETVPMVLSNLVLLLIMIASLFWFGDYLGCRTKITGHTKIGVLLAVILWMIVVFNLLIWIV